MRHVFFAGRGRIDELLIEVFQLKDHSFGFIGDMCNDKWNGFGDVVEDVLKRFSGVKWIVGSGRDWIIDGDINKGGLWVLIRRFQEIGSEIQERRAFSWICLARGRCRGKGGIRRSCGLIIRGHDGVREIKGGS